MKKQKNKAISDNTIYISKDVIQKKLNAELSCMIISVHCPLLRTEIGNK